MLAYFKTEATPLFGMGMVGTFGWLWLVSLFGSICGARARITTLKKNFVDGRAIFARDEICEFSANFGLFRRFFAIF